MPKFEKTTAAIDVIYEKQNLTTRIKGWWNHLFSSNFGSFYNLACINLVFSWKGKNSREHCIHSWNLSFLSVCIVKFFGPIFSIKFFLFLHSFVLLSCVAFSFCLLYFMANVFDSFEKTIFLLVNFIFRFTYGNRGKLFSILNKHCGNTVHLNLDLIFLVQPYY